MDIKLTIPERFHELRKERHLNLEQLAQQTGPSKAALGKYETEDVKDISSFSIVTLARFYGVSADYLLGLTEQKNHPNAELHELHLSDEMIALLKSGVVNNRLLCEVAAHKDFRRLMVDMDIYVDRIASMQIDNLNAYMDTVRQELSQRFHPDENDLYFRTLELSHIQEEAYLGDTLRGDLLAILRDIREAHRKDAVIAPETPVTDDFQQKVAEVMAAKGTEEEKQARIFCHSLGIDYDKLTPEEFVTLIQVLKKSKNLKSSYNKRGRSRPSHPNHKRRK